MAFMIQIFIQLALELQVGDIHFKLEAHHSVQAEAMVAVNKHQFMCHHHLPGVTVDQWAVDDTPRHITPTFGLATLRKIGDITEVLAMTNFTNYYYIRRLKLNPNLLIDILNSLNH